jgi:integrase
VAKRTFGSVDRRHAKIFNAKADAWAWLASQQTDLLRKSWRAPNAVHRTVGEYAEDYLARTDLREGTRALYASLWRHHLAEPWANVPVDELTPAAVRSWHARAGRTTGPTALAQSYRLLRAILNVAVADEAITSNPCRLRGAGTPKATRPSRALTAAEALRLAEQLGKDRRTERYRALVLVLAFGGLRFGEATALRRSDVLENGRLRVERSVRRVGGRWVLGEPKTDAGHRTVTLPAAVAAALEDHLRRHVPASPEALLFSTSSGGYLARSNWNATFRRAADAIGLPAVRPHELRHTGATLAAATGATTKELMRRLGHSSPTAALLYQHAVDDRDADIARALDAMLGAIAETTDDKRWNHDDRQVVAVAVARISDD